MPTDAERIREIEGQIKVLEKERDFFKSKSEEYENGDMALFYAVQRKMKELSKILNKHNLGDVDIDDKNSKTFERLSAILEKCEKYALSANALGSRLGVNASDGQNTESVLRKITTPESMAANLGGAAGQQR